MEIFYKFRRVVWGCLLLAGASVDSCSEEEALCVPVVSVKWIEEMERDTLLIIEKNTTKKHKHIPTQIILVFTQTHTCAQLSTEMHELKHTIKWL